jgi:tetratricopeptide (TPR) repeat protein
VVTDAGEKEGRHVADQFERMRWVFQTLFPKSNVDPIAPIVVIAVRHKEEMLALEPQVYHEKGQVSLVGLFLRGNDKNYILLRTDAADEQHPYAPIYHEYTHLELGTEGMPLWLNEGLAEFFQNTVIQDKDVHVGEVSADNILYLRQNRLIPLPVLFQVDANSPYYHEEQKGTIFYAESWALTHYLEITDFNQHTNRIGTYLGLMNQNEDSVHAATEAFGDLKQLQSALEDYIGHGRYMFFRMNSAAAPIDADKLAVTPLTLPQADAVRADFLAYSGRRDDARALLTDVVKADPKNELAHETMGLIESRDGHREEATKRYAEAVALDPGSYLAQFHLAAESMGGGDTSAAIEDGLRAAIKVNPRFAPAYDSLAVLYGRRREKLDEAHMLELAAVQLEPTNVNYRLDLANILTEQQKYDDAIHVLRGAEEVARSPLEADVVHRVLTQVEDNKAQIERWKKEQAEAQVHTTVATRPPDGAVAPVKLQHPTETPHGPDLTAQGVIRGVHCNGPGVLELSVESAKGSVLLYSNDAYKIDFRALNFTPKDAIQPCQDLEGMKARVHYFATVDKTVAGQITIVALWK